MQVGCGEDKEHICLAYEKDRWVGVRHDALTEEVRRLNSFLYTS